MMATRTSCQYSAGLLFTAPSQNYPNFQRLPGRYRNSSASNSWVSPMWLRNCSCKDDLRWEGRLWPTT